MSQSLQQQQGHYRYDPTQINQAAPARIFPYAGEDGAIRYILSELRHNLLEQGQLSAPLTWALEQIESGNHTLKETWLKLTTLLVDFEIFHIREAASKRFRPIMMTTFAAMAGALPLALGIGAGGELRQPLGIAVLGGLCVSQVLTLFITPVVYLGIEGINARLRARRGGAEVKDLPVATPAAPGRVAAE